VGNPLGSQEVLIGGEGKEGGDGGEMFSCSSGGGGGPVFLMERGDFSLLDLRAKLKGGEKRKFTGGAQYKGGFSATWGGGGSRRYSL